MLFKLGAWRLSISGIPNRRPGKAVCIFPAWKLSGFLRPAQLTLPVRGSAATWRIISGSFIQLWMWFFKGKHQCIWFQQFYSSKRKKQPWNFCPFSKVWRGIFWRSPILPVFLSCNEWLLLQLGYQLGHCGPVALKHITTKPVTSLAFGKIPPGNDWNHIDMLPKLSLLVFSGFFTSTSENNLSFWPWW